MKYEAVGARVGGPQLWTNIAAYGAAEFGVSENLDMLFENDLVVLVGDRNTHHDFDFGPEVFRHFLDLFNRVSVPIVASEHGQSCVERQESRARQILG